MTRDEINNALKKFQDRKDRRASLTTTTPTGAQATAKAKPPLKINSAGRNAAVQKVEETEKRRQELQEVLKKSRESNQQKAKPAPFRVQPVGGGTGGWDNEGAPKRKAPSKEDNVRLAGNKLKERYLERKIEEQEAVLKREREKLNVLGQSYDPNMERQRMLTMDPTAAAQRTAQLLRPVEKQKELVDQLESAITKLKDEKYYTQKAGEKLRLGNAAQAAEDYVVKAKEGAAIRGTDVQFASMTGKRGEIIAAINDPGALRTKRVGILNEGEREVYKHASDEEKNILRYYYAKGDTKSFDAYAESIKREMTARDAAAKKEQREKTRRELEDDTGSDAVGKIASGVASVADGFATPQAYTENMGQAVKNLFAGEYEPTDTNLPGQQAVQRQAERREYVLKDANDTVRFFGNVGFSIADVASKLWMGPQGSLITMSLGAAGASTNDALKRGAAPEQAAAIGTLSGAIEYVTEKLPIDNLFSIAKLGKEGAEAAGKLTFKAAIKNTLQQAGIEATEELVSEYANTLADISVMGKNSEYGRRKSQLIADGMSEAEATKTANHEFFIMQPLMAAAGGALSGGVMGGGANVFNALSTRGERTGVRETGQSAQRGINMPVDQSLVKQAQARSSEAQKPLFPIAEQYRQGQAGRSDSQQGGAQKVNFPVIEKKAILQKNYEQNIDRVIAGESIGKPIIVGDTPSILQEHGAKPHVLTVKEGAIRKIIQPLYKGKEGHNLDPGMVKQLPGKLEQPLAIIKSYKSKNSKAAGTSDSLVVVTELLDKNNYSVIVPVHLDERGLLTPENRIASAYGKREFALYLARQQAEGNLVYPNDKGTIERLLTKGLQLPSVTTEVVPNPIIPNPAENATPQQQNGQALSQKRPSVTEIMQWRDDPSSFKIGQKVNVGEFNGVTILNIDDNANVTFERGGVGEVTARHGGGRITMPMAAFVEAYNKNFRNQAERLYEAGYKPSDVAKEGIRLSKRENETLRNLYIENDIDIGGRLGKDKIENILTRSETFKDKSKISYNNETFMRNLEDIARDPATAQELKDTYVKPIFEGDAENTRWKQKWFKRVKDLNLNKAESAAVQMVYEGAATIDVVSQASDVNKNKILAAIPVFREFYQESYDKAARVLADAGYAIPGYIKNYMPHIGKQIDVFDLDAFVAWFQKGGADTLPTTISGLTHLFKPGRPFFANFQRRTGVKTEYDAVRGFNGYLRGVGNVIHLTESIQRLRQLENGIRRHYKSEADTQIYNKKTASGSDSYIAEGIGKDPTQLTNFVAYLKEFTNVIAGKKLGMDRSLGDSLLGRGVYKLLDGAKRRAGANMVGANISTALTNFIPLTQSLATTKTTAMLKGMGKTIQNIVLPDNLASESQFLTRRFGGAQDIQTSKTKKAWQGTKDAVNFLFEQVDEFVASSIVRGKYYEMIDNGMSHKGAIAYADEYANKLMAGRSVGDKPLLFESKILGPLTQFQLEVNNQVKFLTKDMKRISSEEKKNLALMIIKLFVYSFAYNEINELITGRKPALDPVGTTIDLIEDVSTERKEAGAAAWEFIDSLADQVPYISVLTGGGRIPAASGLPSLEGILTGKDDLGEAAIDFGLTYITPFGGIQARKTYKGIDAIRKEGRYTKDERLMYPVKTDTANTAKGALFGTTGLRENTPYYNNLWKPLSDKQTADYEDLVAKGMDNYEAYETVTGRKIKPRMPFTGAEKIHKTDVWGNKVEGINVPVRGMAKVAYDWYEKPVKQNAVDDEIKRLYLAPAEGTEEEKARSSIKPKKLQRYFEIEGERSYIKATDYEKISNEVGRANYKAINEIIKSPEYQKLSDDDKAEAILKAYTYNRTSAKLDNAIENSIDWDPDISYARMASAVDAGIPASTYILNSMKLSGIQADKDGKGNSVSGTAMAKKAYEIMKLDLTDNQKLLLLKQADVSADIRQLKNLNGLQGYKDYFTLSEKDKMVIVNFSREDLDNAVQNGIPYDAAYSVFSKIDGMRAAKNKNGNSIAYDKQHQVFAYLYNLPGLSAKQKEYIFRAAGYDYDKYVKKYGAKKNPYLKK